jgi:hypothetical protein
MTTTPDDTELDQALEDIEKRNKEKEAADKAAAQAKLDELSKDLLPPPGKPWGDDGHPHIPIEDIVVGKRLRPLDEAAVTKLMDSIRNLGLVTSITVTLYGFKGKPPRNQYLLRAGWHLLEACKRLGWTKIPAIVALLAGPRAELIEIDENLEQNTLSPAMRAIFTAKRKELYLRLHPETAKGIAQGEGKKRSLAAAAGTERQVGGEISDVCGEVSERQVGDEIPNQTPTFVEDTAKHTQRSERSIEREAERGEKIAPDVLAAIKGTSLDNGKYLDKLKGLSHRDQRIQLKQWLAQSDEEKPKSSYGKSSSKGGGSKTPAKGKSSCPKGPPLEHKGEPDSSLKARVEPHFVKLWQLSNAADAIERALVHKGYLPKPSERQLDPKAYLARLTPPKVQSIEKREAVSRGGQRDGEVVTYLHGPADADWDAIQKAEEETKH